MTPTTSAKRFDQIRVGDLLLSRSEFDPEAPLELKRVEEEFDRVARLLRIRVNGRDILTTDEHPFDVDGLGWKHAQSLIPGQQLLTHDGRLVTIEAVEDTGEVAPVFNFRVAEFHTYYVGSPDWGFDVWVHNACNSTILADNMWMAGMPKPSVEMQACHVVPTGAFSHRLEEFREAIADAQSILAGAGIDINSVQNGFWGAVGTPSHMGTHTNEYFLALGRTLNEARPFGPDAVAEALAAFRNSVLNGDFL